MLSWEPWRELASAARWEPQSVVSLAESQVESPVLNSEKRAQIKSLVGLTNITVKHVNQMNDDLWYGIAGLLFGGVMIANWWFEMFSDSAYAKMCRSIVKVQSLGRNTVALFEPAMGMMFVFIGFSLLATWAGVDDNNPLMWILVPGILVFTVIGLTGLIPFRLPGPMYPEWQMEKRRQRRLQSTVERVSSSASKTRTIQRRKELHPGTYDYTVLIPNDDPPPRAHPQETRRRF